MFVSGGAGSLSDPNAENSRDDAGLLFAANARLENRAELSGILSIAPAALGGFTDAALLHGLFRRFGAAGVAHPVGAFAFAAWDGKNQRLTLGRDCYGWRPLFFHRGDGFVAFSSDLSLLLSLPFVPRALDEDVVANYLAVNLASPSRTFYRDIERVPSRMLVTITHDAVRREHYWSPDFDAPPPFKTEADYIERARELLDEAVARATEDTPRMAIMTSGGLDSSAVAATAARLGRARSIACFSVVPPRDFALELAPNWYLSERDKIEALASMHPDLDVQFCEEGELHSRERNPINRFLKLSTPTFCPSNVGAFAPAQDLIAAGRYQACFDGSKGNLGLSWKGNFSLLSLLRKGRFVAFSREFVATSRRTRRGMFNILKGDVIASAAPLRLRRRLYRLYGRDPYDVSNFSCLNPSVGRELAQSGAWERAAFDPRFNFSGWEPARFRARYLFDHNQFSRDGNAASVKSLGYEIRSPLAYRPLIEFLLRVPEAFYRKDGVPRAFARKVLADRLPPEILGETRFGAQGVTWFRRLDARRAELGEEVERLEASPLASRLLDVPRMKRILDDWPKDAQAAQARQSEVRFAFERGVHVGQFIRWVEGGNA